MKKTIMGVVCCIMIVFVMASCKGGKNDKPVEPWGIMNPTLEFMASVDDLNSEDVVSTDASQAEPVINIIIDDGFGMKGFIAKSCTTYTAVLNAIMDVTINGNRNYYSASRLIQEGASAVNPSSDFFKTACQEGFFQEKSNDVSQMIAAIADMYQNDGDTLCILVSDLMMPSEDVCLRTAEALGEKFIKPTDKTVGIIGIEGDFSGTIENLPIDPNTGRSINIREYMVSEKDENNVFKHPIYILFMGNDQAVLSAINKAYANLSESGMLDTSNPIYTQYFSEYGIQHCEKDIKLMFDLDKSDQTYYDNADGDIRFLLRGIPDKNGDVLYGTEFSSELSQVITKNTKVLNDIKIIKMYVDALGKASENVTVSCSIPFTFIDSSMKGLSIRDKYGLLYSASRIKFSDLDYCPVINITCFKESNGNMVPDVEQTIIDIESQEIDKEGIKVVFSLNTELLEQDVPVFFNIGVGLQVTPEWDEISSLYTSDADWVDAMTLNTKTFLQEYAGSADQTTSARYTSKTTAKTPFLSNLLYSGIRDQQIEITLSYIESNTKLYTQNVMFGIVTRNIPARYVQNKKWDKDEDFGGWAFSFNDATNMKKSTTSK